MEKYINVETIVKNEIYDNFKNLIICPICKSVIIEPVKCLECKKIFCKKCKKDLKKNVENCPNNCIKPKIIDIIEKNNLITKFKFKCIKGCGEEIKFKDIKNHYSLDCFSKKVKRNLDLENNQITCGDIKHLTNK